MAVSIGDIFGAGGITGLATKVLDIIFPDPEKKAAAQVALINAQMQGAFKQLEADTQLALAQVQVNVEEAKGGWFRSGWRPAVGWICSIGLGYQIILRPLFSWASEAWWHVPIPPTLEMDTLMTLLFGMLGLGAYRTYEKAKGVENSNG